MSSSPAVGQEHGASISQALGSQKQASEQQVLQLQGMAEDATQKIQASEDDSATLRHSRLSGLRNSESVCCQLNQLLVAIVINNHVFTFCARKLTDIDTDMMFFLLAGFIFEAPGERKAGGAPRAEGSSCKATGRGRARGRGRGTQAAAKPRCVVTTASTRRRTSLKKFNNLKRDIESSRALAEDVLKEVLKHAKLFFGSLHFNSDVMLLWLCFGECIRSWALN